MAGDHRYLMSSHARSLVMVIMMSVAGGLFGPMLQCAAGHTLPPVALASPASTSSSEARIWYPAGHYPQLSLPGGRHEVVRSLLNITKPMHFGDFVWDEDHIPKGPVGVRVDLSRQELSVFRAGHEIGAAVILYGSDGTATPVGNYDTGEERKLLFAQLSRTDALYASPDEGWRGNSRQQCPRRLGYAWLHRSPVGFCTAALHRGGQG
jgi:hypothetical protein